MPYYRIFGGSLAGFLYVMRANVARVVHTIVHFFNVLRVEHQYMRPPILTRWMRLELGAYPTDTLNNHSRSNLGLNPEPLD